MATPSHLLPTACYVCGRDEADEVECSGHSFWSVADADAYFAAEDALNGFASTAEERFVLATRGR